MRGYGAGARDPAECRAQSRHTATHARIHDTALGLAPYGKRYETRSRRRTRPGTRASCSFLQEPWIHGLTAKPDIIERQRSQAQLCDEHRACIVQTTYDGGIRFGHSVSEGLRTVRGWNGRGVEQIFAAPGDSVQGTAIVARGYLAVRLLRLGKRELTGQRDDTTQFWVELCDAFEINVREAFRAELASLHPKREFP
jgi:hypothetical protein